jgi:anti-sigma B factor antagonist
MNALGGCLPIRLEPELVVLDPETAPLLEARLAAIDPSSDVELDLSRIQFCDSVGLRMLVIAYRRHQSAGGHFRIVAAGPVLERVLQLTALDEMLTGSSRRG